MPLNASIPRQLLAGLLAVALHAISPSANAANNDGESLLKMCKGANKVRALGVMCYSYINGYLDTAGHYGKAPFCFKDSDKELVPPMLELWFKSHPEQLKRPTAEVLSKVFTANFPCRK